MTSKNPPPDSREAAVQVVAAGPTVDCDGEALAQLGGEHGSLPGFQSARRRAHVVRDRRRRQRVDGGQA